MKRLVIAIACTLSLAACTGPAPTPTPTPSQTPPSASPTATVTVTATPTPSVTPSPAPALAAWPWGIDELATIKLGETFKAIAKSTGDAVTPCPNNDDAYFAVGNDWLLAVRGQGKDIMNEGGYIAQTATALALLPKGSVTGPVGPVGPVGLQLGSTEDAVVAAMPDATATAVDGATLYVTTMPDGSTLSVEVTDGLVSRIVVSKGALSTTPYDPLCN